MPTTPFFQIVATGQERKRMVGDASDFTRYRRIVATQAPFLASLPKLGWRDQGANLDARLIFPIFGIFRGNFPNPN